MWCASATSAPTSCPSSAASPPPPTDAACPSHSHTHLRSPPARHEAPHSFALNFHCRSNRSSERRRKRTAAISENLQTERKFVHLTEPPCDSESTETDHCLFFNKLRRLITECVARAGGTCLWHITHLHLSAAIHVPSRIPTATRLVTAIEPLPPPP